MRRASVRIKTMRYTKMLARIICRIFGHRWSDYIVSTITREYEPLEREKEEAKTCLRCGKKVIRFFWKEHRDFFSGDWK
jgi:hypothetical protein